jgi:hypothetical protein
MVLARLLSVDRRGLKRLPFGAAADGCCWWLVSSCAG